MGEIRFHSRPLQAPEKPLPIAEYFMMGNELKNEATHLSVTATRDASPAMDVLCRPWYRRSHRQKVGRSVPQPICSSLVFPVLAHPRAGSISCFLAIGHDWHNQWPGNKDPLRSERGRRSRDRPDWRCIINQNDQRRAVWQMNPCRLTRFRSRQGRWASASS
jgi:hypothetical protein